MLVFGQKLRNTAKQCLLQLKLLENCLKLPEPYKFSRNLKTGHFDVKYLSESNGKQIQIRLINSSIVEKEHIKDVLKETIVFTRIKCDEIIQCYTHYFFENKHLFIVTSHIDVNIAVFVCIKFSFLVFILLFYYF